MLAPCFILMPPLRRACQALQLRMPHVENPHISFAVQLPVPFVGSLFFTIFLEFITLVDFHFNIKYNCTIIMIIRPQSKYKLTNKSKYPSIFSDSNSLSKLVNRLLFVIFVL